MMKIIRENISVSNLKELAKEDYVTMIKAVVDIEREIMAVGGELHSDEEMMLLDDGSEQKNLWGINIKFDRPRNEWVEFDSLINIRPRYYNQSRGVENPEIREKIIRIVNKLIT
jgi:hypothetical protein